MTSSAVEVSVIVPAYNAARTIVRQLAALRDQVDAPSWELIVADNGSRDATRQIVQNAAADFPVPLHLVDASAHRGAGAARNAGVRASRGAKLLFCDADDVVFPNWVAAGATALEASAVVAGGSVAMTTPPNVDGPLLDPNCVIYCASGPAAASGNFGVRRDLYFTAGGFDASLGAYGFEDSELSIRFHDAGYVPVAAPDMRIHYRDTTTLRGQFRKTWQRSQAEVAMWFRHPEAYGTFLDDELLRHQLLGWAAWHVQLARQGQRKSVHDITKDAVIRLARYRSFKRIHAAGGIGDPVYVGSDPLSGADETGTGRG